MCCTGKSEKNGCRKPERLRGAPEECPPEQIRECHGESGEHPCTGKKK